MFTIAKAYEQIDLNVHMSYVNIMRQYIVVSELRRGSPSSYITQLCGRLIADITHFSSYDDKVLYWKVTWLCTQHNLRGI